MDTKLAGLLKAELLRSIAEYSRDRVVSTPPSGADNSVTDLHSEDDGAGGRILTWAYRNVGDYDQNSEVNAADITPVGLHYGATSASPSWPAARLADGDGNGEVNVADITPIGRNFNTSCTKYVVYSSTNAGDYPASHDAANGPGAVRLGEITMAESTEGAGGIKLFSYALGAVEAGALCWVRPSDGTEEGSRSNLHEIPIPPNEIPLAVIAADPTVGDIPMLVQFDASGSSDPDGSIVKYEWDWDGFENGWVWEDTGTTPTASYTYTEIDTYTAVLRVTDDDGDANTASIQVHATAQGNDPPVVVLTADPTSGPAPLTVSFDASGSYDIDGEIVKYEWDWDGMQGGWEWEDTETTPTATHTYAEIDTYTAFVRVTDNQGAIDTTSLEISATSQGNDPPVAVLTADPTSGPAPLTVSFDASGSYDIDGEIVKYEWNWDWDGDGEFSADEDTGETPTTSHEYEAGSYSAWVRVTDELGGQDITSVNISSTLPPAPWLMFGHDLQHTSRSPFIGAQTNNVKWSYTTGDEVRSSPSIGKDGTVYVGSQDHKLYAINPDGSLKWSYTMGDGTRRSSPAIGADGTVYVGSDKFYAINPDGSLKWSYTTGGAVASSPAIGADGTVYVGSSDDNLYAINPDGSLKWLYTTGASVASSPAIGVDGTIYVGRGDLIGGLDENYFYALNPNGSLKWSFTTEGDVLSSPAIGADGTVYIGSEDGKVHAINPDGSLKWSYVTGGEVFSAPAIGADGTVYVSSFDSRLYAIKPDGSLKWSYTMGDRTWSSPAIGADGTVYVGSHDFNIYAINPNGSLKWWYATGDRVFSSPAIGADGTVYVGSDDGKLYAFGP